MPIPMWIAVPDGPPEPHELRDPYESQIGGRVKVPRWAPGFTPRRCQCVCGRPMVLVVQAFCPSEGWERILLIFACNRAVCQKDPLRSWQAWRLQRRELDDQDQKEQTLLLEGDDVVSTTALPCQALDMFEEPADESKKVDVEAEWRKMQEVNQRTNPDITGKDLEELGIDEAKMDLVFFHFQERLSRSPQQVIRWGRGGQPLWISKHQCSPTVPPCSGCGATRLFELQVMPTLVYYLRPQDHTDDKEDEGLDFGTITLYTCSQSCQLEGNVCPEYVHYQPPPSD
eukprot:NODE_3323_length_989_cov_63.096288_g3177_i0.p1 GENE.NODE_3323_length_989_cov_63.096288_g3177_i0~~NODE_3323_length_989_cov_63.096288_g3177_i0.p1  ORF type:complete len:310 (+),score=66.63 NODE_3323_length_989_cov_63.096288_g3177_i0:76-930(+)